jgi:hypothetical protein
VPVGNRRAATAHAGTVTLPAAERALLDLIAGARIPLPSDYVAFLAASNGGEGELSTDPHWLVVWPAEDVLANNEKHQVAKWVPGLFAFGTSGDGEMFAFDTRAGEPYSIVYVPFIPMTLDEARRIAGSFAELLAHMGETA